MDFERSPDDTPPLRMKIQRGPARVTKANHSKIRAALACLPDTRRRLAALATIIVVSAGAAGQALGAECSASSRPQRTALLELYTSEGCNSCPPAERWLSGIRAHGIRPDQLVPLAFHVDYWDYIGWIDRYAQPGFTGRQRLIADRNHASFIYTPQFVLNGRDFQRPWLGDKLAKQLAAVNPETATLNLNAELGVQDQVATLSVRVRNEDKGKVHFYAALFENGLSSEVQAGENAGKRLYHEFVVRRLEGPLVIAPGTELVHDYSFDLAPYVDRSRLGFVLFGEDGTTGSTLQAMTLPICPQS